MFKLLLFLVSLSTFAKFNIVHYNIKELTTLKLLEKNEQLKAVKAVLRNYRPDILSINEMQYDLPGVPFKGLRSRGQNAASFLKIISKPYLKNISFNQANTGNLASKLPNGNYVTRATDETLKYADQVNFGLFPGQYSTAAMYRYYTLNKKVITNLKWKDFNPELDLSPYLDGLGNPLPESMELFDKNFSDITIKIEGRKVHLILLHTVPAHHFGNTRSVNAKRNADQLRFLEWYLTGKTDIDLPREIRGIKPLKANATFVALGDWNVDINGENEGADVLKRLFEKTQNTIDPKFPTYLGMNFSPKNQLKLTLDYIVTSNDLKIIEAHTHSPKEVRKELGCEGPPRRVPRSKKLVTYKDDGETCYASVSSAFYNMKTASDHIPLKAILEFR